MRLSNKVALITGGGGGIGRAIVLRFLQEGALVAFCDIDTQAGEHVLQEASRFKGNALFVQTDVTKRSEVRAMVKTVCAHFGRLDVLGNIAGIAKDALSWKLDEKAFDEVVESNLKSTFLCCQAALEPMMTQKAGTVLNTSSVSAVGNIGQINYAAAKAAIIGLTKTLALESAPYNITVNCVAPGFTQTRMTAGIPDKIKEKILNKIPLKRMATPEEIASIYTFLASDEARYITGQLFTVDGGLTAGF